MGTEIIALGIFQPPKRGFMTPFLNTYNTLYLWQNQYPVSPPFLVREPQILLGIMLHMH